MMLKKTLLLTLFVTVSVLSTYLHADDERTVNLPTAGSANSQDESSRSNNGNGNTKKSSEFIVTDKQLNDKAFKTLMDELNPVSPNDIKKLKKKDSATERAFYNEVAPSPITDIVDVSLKPGAKPPVIYVASGYVTTLSIIDATGKSWPLTNAIVGNKQDYDVESIGAHEYKNLIAIQPIRRYGSSNLTFTLVGQPTPITLRLENNTKKYHSTPIIQVQGYGPLAEKLTYNTLRSIPDDLVLKNVLVGIGPKNAVKMKSSDDSVEIWRVANWLYVRSPYKGVNPLPISIMNANSYSAYKITNTPVLYMVDDQGHRHKVYVKESGLSTGVSR